MEAINIGWLSVLPPLIAIVLALISKEVISSLLVGILSGAFLYSINTGGGVVKTVDITFSVMAEKMCDNINIIIFLGLLGALVVIVTKAGGSKAYGEWATKKIKTQTGAKLATSALGALIFIDDYFNCLTVGTVMRPVTDKYKMSRAKLAYIIDATAAPVCIIAPVSSWAAAVASQMEENGFENGFQAFINTIPFNLYAILTIIMLLILAFSKFDFGSMAKCEKRTAEAAENGEMNVQSDIDNVKIEGSGKVIDLVLPIISLIVFSILAMLYVGGYFKGEGMGIAEAFGNTDASVSLVLGGFAALVITFIFYIPRKILSFRSFMESIGEGIKSMVPADIILILAWTISGICRDLIGTGTFVGNAVAQSNMPVQLLPAIIFAVAGALAFATGTSWGTFGILIPIVTIICNHTDPTLMFPVLGATLAGAVFGDHISPISDTTILASTGAGCNHLEHVSTQIPYASIVAGSSFVGYLVSGFTDSAILSFISGLAVLIILLIVIKAKTKSKAI